MAIKASEFVWHNGHLIPWDDAKIHVMAHVVNYGSSVFEGIRCYQTPKGPAIFRLRDHTLRLIQSCKIYRIDLDLFAGRADPGNGRPGRGQQSLALLHPPHRAARLWPSWRQSVQLANRGLHRQL